MLLTIDVGNTNTVIGCFDGDEMTESWRIKTDARATADEIALLLRGLLDEQPRAVAASPPARPCPPCCTSCAACSSATTATSRRSSSSRACGPACRSSTTTRERSAPTASSTPLAAHHLYGGPAVVVDFGTSTNFDVVSERGEFLGGALAPGIEISVDALAARAARLLKVELVRAALRHRQVDGRGAAVGHHLRLRRPDRRHRAADRRASWTRSRSSSPPAASRPLVLEESATITHHEPDLTLIGLRSGLRPQPVRNSGLAPAGLVQVDHAR